ncbi:GumC family protein [Cohaesibacter sp. CAU 1516]|uniref:GumC family protein n=1 Tax=Cohaesibacter sp. CAU 1516 TaxID=2576038 RepID=UPI00148523AA|nr:GumC family protein [Cohaesibacter sp. CAU 1516]
MFGRKKKTRKQDLDWQPSGEELVNNDQGVRAHSPINTDPQPRRAEPLYPSASEGAGGDTWAGLIHPLSIARFLLGNLRSIIKVALVVLIVGMGIYLLVPNTYGTKALILVDPRQPRVTNNEAVLSGIGGDAAALTSYVEVMNSDGFLGKVVDELDVKSDPTFAKATSKTELIGMFRSNLSAYRQGATYIVEVYYKSKNKENAAKYANGVAEAFVRDQRDFRAETSADASRWLSERLTALQANLKKSEDAVAAFQARSGIVNAGAQGTLDDQQLTSLVQQLATVSTELAEARARYLQASKNGEPASANNGQSNQFVNLDQLLQEQDRLRRQAAELNQTLGSRHPRVLANAEQQRIIAGQVAQERRRLVQRTNQAYQTAKAKKQSIESQLADARQRAIKQNTARVELANLERQATANRNLYEQFLERYKITDEQSNFQFSEARIVSPAPVPIKSNKPSLKLVLPVLVVLGAFLGLLLAMVRQAMMLPLPQSLQHQRSADAAIRPQDPPLMAPSDSRRVDVMDCPPEALLEAVAARDLRSLPSDTDTQPDEAHPDEAIADDATKANETVAVSDTVDQDVVSTPDVDLDTDAEEPHSQSTLVTEQPDDNDNTALQEDLSLLEAELSLDEAQLTSNEGDLSAVDAEGELEDRVVHLKQTQPKSRQSARAERIAAATRTREAARAEKRPSRRRTRLTSSAVLMSMPYHDVDNRDRVLDTMLNTHQDKLEQFLAAGLAEDHVCLLVAAAQDGVRQEATSDLFREFAFDEGFHPVVISLQDQAEKDLPPPRKGSTVAAPERVARLQEFEGFDQIPFLIGSALLMENGLEDELARELTSLLTLCKDRYGFVILETHQVAHPAVLEDLIQLADAAVLVLDEQNLPSDEMLEWQDWAEENAVGLVMDQTQN